MSQTKAQLIDNLVQPITGAAGSASAPTFSFTADPNSGLYSVGADQLALSTGGTGRLFIDASGNVGIGAAPATIVDSTQSAAAAYSSWTIRNTASNGYVQQQFLVGASGANGQASVGYAPGIFFAIGPVANDTTTPIVFRTNNATERMRLDSSGRLGLGDSSPGALLSLKDGNVDNISGSKLRMNLGPNPYWELQANNGGTSATRKLEFYTSSGSGTVLTLLQSGAVGVGTTSSPVGASIRLTLDGSNGGGVELVANNNGGGALVPSTGGGIQFYTHTGAVGSESYSERMRITDIGELGINTSSPLSKLGIAYTATGGASDGIRLSDTTNTTVSVLGTTGSSYSYAGVTGHNTLLYGSRDLAICADNANNGIIKFMAGGNERMRINTNGRLLIGTTTDPGYQLSVVGQNSYAFGARQDVGNWTYPVGTFHSTFTTGDNYLIDFYTDAISFRGRIDYNRAAGQIRYNITSDQRLKSQIKPAQSALGSLLALKVRSYIWNETNYQVNFGFVAQELHSIIPDAVKAGDYGDQITDPWSVDNSKLVPLLTKALQEAIGRIETLEAEVITLKTQ